MKTLHSRWIAAFCLGLLLVACASVSAQSATATATPTAPIVLSGHTGAVSVLAWSPDGTLLASAAGGFQSSDDSVRLWRVDGSLAAVLSGHTGAVNTLAWSPDGKILASGGFDGEIGLWSPDGSLIKMINTQAGTVFKLAWSPDGKILASGSILDPTHNTVQWWSPSGDLLITRTTAYSGGKFYNLGWSPDGKYLVGGATSYTEWRTDGTLVFSDTACAACTPRWGFAWSPDSSRWGVGDESGSVIIYGTDGKQIASVQDSYGSADVLAWSPDGKTLAGGNLSLWSADGKLINAYNLSIQTVTALAWSPDGRLLVSGDGLDNAIYVWDANLHRLAPLKGHTGQVISLAWSPDGTMLASGSQDQTIRLWKIAA